MMKALGPIEKIVETKLNLVYVYSIMGDNKSPIRETKDECIANVKKRTEDLIKENDKDYSNDKEEQELREQRQKQDCEKIIEGEHIRTSTEMEKIYQESKNDIIEAKNRAIKKCNEKQDIEGGKRRTRKRGKKARRSKKNNKKRKGKKSKRTRKHK